MIKNQPRFDLAIKKINEANSEDPNKETYLSKEYPKELLYSARMTEWLLRLSPEASENLLLAAHGQHIMRWSIPRESFPMDRTGYLKWRTQLKMFHAEKMGEILSDCGYNEDEIRSVQGLIKKEKLKTDPESQLLEDVVCLVFLESYFTEFLHKHEEQKIIEIIQKTWRKMSEKGHLEALKLQLPKKSVALIEKALA